MKKFLLLKCVLLLLVIPSVVGLSTITGECFNNSVLLNATGTGTSIVSDLYWCADSVVIGASQMNITGLEINVSGEANYDFTNTFLFDSNVSLNSSNFFSVVAIDGGNAYEFTNNLGAVVGGAVVLHSVGVSPRDPSFLASDGYTNTYTGGQYLYDGSDLSLNIPHISAGSGNVLTLEGGDAGGGSSSGGSNGTGGGGSGNVIIINDTTLNTSFIISPSQINAVVLVKNRDVSWEKQVITNRVLESCDVVSVGDVTPPNIFTCVLNGSNFVVIADMSGTATPLSTKYEATFRLMSSLGDVVDFPVTLSTFSVVIADEQDELLAGKLFLFVAAAAVVGTVLTGLLKRRKKKVFV